MALRDRSELLYFAAGAASFAAVSLAFTALTSSSSGTRRAIKSPLHTTAAVTSPYPAADFIPGARDIDTPYGSIRTYEFGAEDAERRVLLVHGISVPSIALSGIAEGLVSNGCRVMLLDLFGRGYSDGPTDLPYDDRLYISQIFMALTASPLGWTGDGKRFSLIGYSMGGGIAMSFTSYFPDLIDDLVLLAPAGLIRHSRSTFAVSLVTSGFLTGTIAQRGAERNLKFNPNVSTAPVAGKAGPRAFGHDIDAQKIIAWQIDNHEGFLPAFVSSSRFAPLRDQHERWTVVARRLNEQRARGGAEASQYGLKSGRVLMVLGSRDNIVHSDDLRIDAVALLGPQNIYVREFDAGHEVPVTFASDIIDFIWSKWQANS